LNAVELDEEVVLLDAVALVDRQVDDPPHDLGADLYLDVGLDLARRLDGTRDLAARHRGELYLDGDLAVQPPFEAEEVRLALEVGDHDGNGAADEQAGEDQFHD